ncbi:unnamed protein product [Thlaspi arvense]|uniref:F-box domain-containing protein n=1 Tax=Thlaspi arvense TaxID=13288 RepID=A0AAU9RDN8_THLAR|nr:unnamed protein product [Thlaspi arvense]
MAIPPWRKARLRHGGSSTSTRGIDIPLELTVDILKKLPAKSLVRFRCVSKQWLSIISRRRGFIDSIVTRSSTQPPRDAHLIFENIFSHRDVECCMVLSSSSRSPEEKSLLSIPEGTYDYVRGLILSWSDYLNRAVIYNPTTRQCLKLPEKEVRGGGSCYLGYDPLENEYKVLFIPIGSMEQACRVFTLGAKQWRTIQGVASHGPLFGAVCIDGFIYYIAKAHDCEYAFLYQLMSFDVRSEKFYRVDAPETLKDHASALIDYQGKLGFVCCKKGMEIWVVDDKQSSWSRLFFYEMRGFQDWRVSGVTRRGEIVFTSWMYVYLDILCVFYYDPKQNSVRDVDFDQGTFSDASRRNSSGVFIWTLPDYVENTMLLY